MKTVTEFDGITLKNAFRIRESLVEIKKKLKPGASPTVKNAAATEGDTAENAPAESVTAENTLTAEPSAPDLPAQEDPGVGVSEEALVTADAEIETAAPAESEITDAPSSAATPESPESTESSTATDGTRKKLTVKTRQEVEEERKKYMESVKEDFSKQLGENSKISAERLDLLLNALDCLERNRLSDIRRIVIFTLGENEKAPPSSKKIGEHFYLADYMVPVNKGLPGRGRARGGSRAGARDGRGGPRGRGRGGPGRDRSDPTRDRSGPGGRNPNDRNNRSGRRPPAAQAGPPRPPPKIIPKSAKV